MQLANYNLEKVFTNYISVNVIYLNKIGKTKNLWIQPRPMNIVIIPLTKIVKLH